MPEYLERITEDYQDVKVIEGFAKLVSLEDIRSNDGNLSNLHYIRGKAMSDEKGKYVAAGLKEAVKI